MMLCCLVKEEKSVLFWKRFNLGHWYLLSLLKFRIYTKFPDHSILSGVIALSCVKGRYE